MKHINIKYIYFLVYVLLLFTSACKKDWLDKKPDKNLTVPQTLTDFEALLDDQALYLRSALTLSEVGADGHTVLESRWATGFDPYLTNAFTWSNALPYTSIADWNGAYSHVFACNVILEGIEKIKPGNAADLEKWNTIKGGALFQRARNVFELAQTFQIPYEASTAQSDLGIPLRLESDISIPAKRSSAKQVYEQILQDLDAANLLLPAIPKFKTRGSKMGVHALLARVYLSMRNYTMAGIEADECLKINSSLIDYNNLNKSANFVGALNAEVLFHDLSVNYNIITTSAKIELSVYNSYEENDLRKAIFFRKEAAGTIVFKGNYNNAAAPLFFGATTAEMFLIRAECNARAGKADEAMDDLNTLLKKRWVNTVPFPLRIAVDSDDALSQILTERKKELIMRGQRWCDLRRFNKEPKHAIVLTKTIGGKTFTLEPNSYKYTLPIPDDIIQLSGIQQNPGWNK